MARLKATYEGGAKFTVACRTHEITVDQPVDNGGDDAGMTPPELMAGSMASCIGFYVARYCEQANIEATGLYVSADWQVGGKPKHMEAFDIEVYLPEMPENRRAAIERVASGCLIHNTLHAQPIVNISIKV